MKANSLITILLSLVLCVFSLPNNIFVKAEEIEISTWNGGIDTSWYDSQDSELYISTAEELAGFAQLVNDKKKTFTDQTVYLKNDIDLNNKKWTPIGLTFSQIFAGTFDGQSHIIKGLYINYWDTECYGGFFGVIQANIKNVIIENCNITFESTKSGSPTYTGGICGYLFNGSVTNCKVSGKVVSSKKGYTSAAGGICGYQSERSFIDNCGVDCNVESYNTSYNQYSYAGGICGASFGTLNISNCYNLKDIKASTPSIYGVAGGIVGHIERTSIIENTYNAGQLDAKNSGAIVGDIGKDVTIKNSYYLSSSANSGVGNGGTDTTISKSSINMKKNDFSESLGNAYAYNESGFPLLKWEIGEAIVDIPTTTSTSTFSTTEPTTTTITTLTTTETTTTSLTTTTKLSIEKNSISLKNGDQYTIKANQTGLTYSSNNKNVAIVSKDGIVTAIGEGEATISVINADSDVVQLKIIVEAVTTVKLKLGDVNADNIIDGRDATAVLTYYAITSTGGNFDNADFHAEYADYNADGIVDARDATAIITYYAKSSTEH